MLVDFSYNKHPQHWSSAQHVTGHMRKRMFRLAACLLHNDQWMLVHMVCLCGGSHGTLACQQASAPAYQLDLVLRLWVCCDVGVGQVCCDGNSQQWRGVLGGV